MCGYRAVISKCDQPFSLRPPVPKTTCLHFTDTCSKITDNLLLFSPITIKKILTNSQQWVGWFSVNTLHLYSGAVQSNLNQNTVYPDRVFHRFPHSLYKNVRIVPQLGYDHHFFLPNSSIILPFDIIQSKILRES